MPGNRPEANDVVFIGDSTCLCDAAQTRLFQQKTGRSAYNLGTVGVIGIDGYPHYPGAAYLQHHPKPKMLILCVTPKSIALPTVVLGQAFEQDRFLQFFGSDNGDFEPTAGNPVIVAIRRGILSQLCMPHRRV